MEERVVLQRAGVGLILLSVFFGLGTLMALLVAVGDSHSGSGAAPAILMFVASAGLGLMGAYLHFTGCHMPDA